MAQWRRRVTKSDGIVRWLLPASVLHAAVVLLAIALAPKRPVTAELVVSSPELTSQQMEWTVDSILLESNGAGSALPSAPERSTPIEATARADGESWAPPTSSDTPRPSAARAGATTPAQPSDGEPAASMQGAGEPPRQATPALSLEQLGIGTNLFLGVAVQPLTLQEKQSARLDAAMKPPSAGRQSVGPSGPVVAAARRLLQEDDSLVETNAVLNVRVDGSGHVTEVHVLDTSGQSKAWELIAARIAQALGPVQLRTDSGQGWSVKLRLASSVQLPSGAAPGMRIGVLGQQVAGSGGPGSTSLELSPTSKLDMREIQPDNVGRQMDHPIQFEAMLLKLRADPADIGSTARRVVEVAVLSIDGIGAR